MRGEKTGAREMAGFESEEAGARTRWYRWYRWYRKDGEDGEDHLQFYTPVPKSTLAYSGLK